jgi:hypothetical protein
MGRLRPPECPHSASVAGESPGMIAATAAAYAAADLGYAGVAALILEKQLGPQAIARLFAYGVARDCGRACALVLLAAATARHHAYPVGWNGDLERGLAKEAFDLHRSRNFCVVRGRPTQAADQATWNKITKEAAAIVGEIAAA